MRLFALLATLLIPSLLSADLSKCPSPPRLELFYSPYCPYSHRVLTYLESIHKRVPLRDVAHDKGAKEELKTKGGKAQVPCLFIDGVPLYESDRIINWMGEHKSCLAERTQPTAKAPKARTSRGASRARYRRSG